MERMRSFYFFSILLVLALAFFGGAYALETFGIQYVSEGGPAIYKIHVYSYLSLAIFSIYFLQSGLIKISNDLGVFFKSWFLLLLSIVYLIVYGLIKFGTSGMAYVVDTLLVPILIFPILFTFNTKQSRKIAKFIFILLLINSLAAIYEYVQGIQIFPFEYEEHWVYFRSTAFFSHPLNNALIVSFLAISLYKFRFVNPIILFLLVSLSIFCFGARTATFIFVTLSIIELLRSYRERYKMKKGLVFSEFLIVKIVVFFGLGILFYAVFYLNFGQRIFENITLDGSARSRFDVFNVFDYLSFNEYIFGARPEFFENMMLYIDNGVVENFVIGWFLFYGLAGSMFVILFFYRFIAILFFRGGAAERISVMSFVLISISNNSLASKTPVLLFLLAVYVSCYKVKASIASNSEV